MNYKLEKFWNLVVLILTPFFLVMNYKLEKFWNVATWVAIAPNVVWTINLKSFEILNKKFFRIELWMNYKLEKFWNAKTVFIKAFSFSTWTINLKSFEIVPF